MVWVWSNRPIDHSSSGRAASIARPLPLKLSASVMSFE